MPSVSLAALGRALQRPSAATAFLLALVLGCLFGIRDEYYISIATVALIYFIAALGYTLVITKAGLFHLGFAVNSAIGGYTAAILMVKLDWSFAPSCLMALLMTAASTAVTAVPTLRLRGDYLSIVTLAFSLVVQQILANWESLTNGSLGIPGVPYPAFLGLAVTDPHSLCLVVGVAATIALFTYLVLVRSRYGLMWDVVRQNEEAAAACGLRPWWLSFWVLIVGSLYGAVSGVLYAAYSTIVDPSMAGIDNTMLMLAIVILSGGSWLGLLIASVVLIALPQLFLGLELYRQLGLGLFLIAVINLRPGGLSFGKAILYGTADAPSRSNDAASPVQFSSREPAVQAIHLSRSFGGLKAVQDVSFEVPSGMIYGIIGPNGAGKTTIFNLLTGADQPSDGRALLMGRDVGGYASWQISRLGVGRTFQNIKLFPENSVLDNVLSGAAWDTLLRPWDRQIWRRAVERSWDALLTVGIEHMAFNPAGSLSYADQRRLEIARAIAMGPRVLFLDEPAAGMNPTELRILSELVKKIRDRGITVVCIEHNMPFLVAIADRILVVATGQVLMESAPGKVMRDPKVIEVYLGRRAVHVAGE